MTASPVTARYIRSAALARTAATAEGRANAAYEAEYVAKTAGLDTAALAADVDSAVAASARRLTVVH